MSLDACAERVARGDPDRFQSVMAAPVAARAKLLPIYAFNVEVTRAPWVTAEPMIAEMRLQWWRDVLEEIADGRPVRAHEIATPLADVLDPTAAQTLDHLVAARRWDVYKDAFEDEAHFDDYLDKTSGGLMWVAAQAMGAPAGPESAIRDVGWASGLAGWFAAIPELEARGRKPLVDGRTPAVAALAKSGLERLRRGVRDGARGPATYPAWMAGAVLSQVARQPDRVASGSVENSEFRRRFRLMRTGLTGRIPL